MVCITGGWHQEEELGADSVHFSGDTSILPGALTTRLNVFLLGFNKSDQDSKMILISSPNGNFLP